MGPKPGFSSLNVCFCCLKKASKDEMHRIAIGCVSKRPEVIMFLTKFSLQTRKEDKTSPNTP